MENLDHQEQITVDLSSKHRKSDYKYRVCRSEAYASKKSATVMISKLQRQVINLRLQVEELRKELQDGEKDLEEQNLDKIECALTLCWISQK